jgi:hypothetical protein
MNSAAAENWALVFEEDFQNTETLKPPRPFKNDGTPCADGLFKHSQN